MGQHFVPPDRTTIAQLARLTARLAHPLEFVHDDHLTLPPLDAKAVRRLARQPGFRRPLNRAASRSLGLPALSLPRDLASRLQTEEDLKIALNLLQCDRAVLLDCARHCAAIQLYPQVRACVLKAQRKRIEAILGSDAFLTAVRETPVFCPSLPERSSTVRLDNFLTEDEPWEEDATPPAREEATDTIHPLVWEGLATLIAFTRRADRGCATLFALRFPKPGTDDHTAAGAVTDEQAAELKPLLRKRGLTW